MTGEIVTINGKILNTGVRYITSFLFNRLVADGYGAGNTIDYIHFGSSDKEVETTDYRLDWYVNRRVITRTEIVSDRHLRFEASMVGLANQRISEIGLALDANPASAIDYPNAVIAKASLKPQFYTVTGNEILKFDLYL